MVPNDACIIIIILQSQPYNATEYIIFNQITLAGEKAKFKCREKYIDVLKLSTNLLELDKIKKDASLPPGALRVLETEGNVALRRLFDDCW